MIKAPSSPPFGDADDGLRWGTVLYTGGAYQPLAACKPGEMQATKNSNR